MISQNSLSEHYDELIDILGGEEIITYCQRYYCRVAADLFQQIDAHIAELLTGGDFDEVVFVEVNIQLLDTLDRLGINDPSDFCRDRVQ